MRAYAVLLTVLFAGCRCGPASIADSDAAPPTADGPIMPRGMLGTASAALEPAADAVTKLSIARGKKGGEFAELQTATAGDAPDKTDFTHWKADSIFLSLDAMTVLHDPFARSLPGFDLFLPRLFGPTALGRLKTELATLRTQLAPMQTVAAAKTRWAEVATVIRDLPDDAAWLRARAALIATIDELSVLIGGLEKGGQSLWVLGI